MILTRRTALKTIAAALMVPQVRLRKEIDREELMRKFCSRDGDWLHRYDLETPFQHGSLTYATDSRRMVRAELTSPCLVGERKLPPVDSCWKESWQPGKWVPLRRPELGELVSRNVNNLDLAICPVCDGRMVSLGEHYPEQEKLEDIHRRGIRWDVDENIVGDESCPTCRGRDYEGPDIVMIGGQGFSYSLLRPIWDLPGEVSATISKFDQHPLLFRCDGFEGIAMSLYPSAIDAKQQQGGK